LRATAARNNRASVRILEKCGFRCMGYRQGEETERYSAREVGDFVLE
jgi:RimJ/RimL family protein N-acetyltransferase